MKMFAMISMLKRFCHPQNAARCTSNMTVNPKKMSTMHNMKSKELKKKLIVDPHSCFHEEPVHIAAIGLIPGAEVTLTSTVQDNQNYTYFSYTHYIADDSGIVDLQYHEAIRGTYQGLFPMGPIACLLPGPAEKKRKRFFMEDYNKQFMVNMKLLQGHLGKSEAYDPAPQLILDSTNHERIYLAPGCERIPVRCGRIRGTLFLPPGDGPFPGVIDVFGLRGGLIEFRSAQLATRGIASLSLAFFRYEDLPETIQYIDMDYFEEAAHFLLNHDKVKKPSIGIIGTSAGGCISCSVGTFIPEVKAVVCYNGFPANVAWPLKVKEKEIPGLGFHNHHSKLKFVTPELVSIVDMLHDSEDYPETWIPIHEADAEFLFLVSKDDQNWNTEKEVFKGIERLKAKGKNNFQVLTYDGAGHLLEPPYSPFCEGFFHKLAGMNVTPGGNPIDHSNAQVDAWDHSLKFIRRVLS